MDYIKGLPLAPHRCRSAPHQLPLATAVCTQCLNAVVVVPNPSIASSVFLAGLINSPMVKEQIERTLVGSTQRVVNTKSIASLKVRIPSATVQSQYEEFVKQTDKSKLAVQQSLDKLEILKKSLMQKYFG